MLLIYIEAGSGCRDREKVIVKAEARKSIMCIFLSTKQGFVTCIIVYSRDSSYMHEGFY